MYILNSHIQMAVPSMLYFLLRRWSNSRILFGALLLFWHPLHHKATSNKLQTRSNTHKKIRKHKPRTRRKEHSKWRELKQGKRNEKCGKTRIREQSPKVLAFKPAVSDACFLQLGMTVASWQESLKSSILPRFLQVQLKSIDDTTKGGACEDGFTFGVWKVGFWIINNLQLKVALLRCHVMSEMIWNDSTK